MSVLAVCLIENMFFSVRNMFLKVTIIVSAELLLWQVFTEIRKHCDNNDDNNNCYNNTLYFTKVNKVYKKKFSSRH